MPGAAPSLRLRSPALKTRELRPFPAPISIIVPCSVRQGNSNRKKNTRYVKLPVAVRRYIYDIYTTYLQSIADDHFGPIIKLLLIYIVHRFWTPA